MNTKVCPRSLWSFHHRKYLMTVVRQVSLRSNIIIFDCILQKLPKWFPTSVMFWASLFRREHVSHIYNEENPEILPFNEKCEGIIGKHEIRSLAPSNLGKLLNPLSALVSAINKMKGNTLHFKKVFFRIKYTNSCEVFGTITVSMCKHTYREPWIKKIIENTFYEKTDIVHVKHRFLLKTLFLMSCRIM